MRKPTTEERNLLTTWIPTGLFCIAGIINATGVAPIWLFMVFMVPGLIILAIGFYDINRQWRAIEKTLTKEPNDE